MLTPSGRPPLTPSARPRRGISVGRSAESCSATARHRAHRCEHPSAAPAPHQRRPRAATAPPQRHHTTSIHHCGRVAFRVDFMGGADSCCRWTAGRLSRSRCRTRRHGPAIAAPRCTCGRNGAHPKQHRPGSRWLSLAERGRVKRRSSDWLALFQAPQRTRRSPAAAGPRGACAPRSWRPSMWGPRPGWGPQPGGTPGPVG